MGERRRRNCNRPVLDGVYCQLYDSEIVAGVLRPPSGGCGRKVHRFLSANISNQLRLIG